MHTSVHIFLCICPHVCLCILKSGLTSPYWKTIKNLFWLCHCLCSAKQRKKLGKMKYCLLKWNKISSCKSTLWERTVCPSFCQFFTNNFGANWKFQASIEKSKKSIPVTFMRISICMKINPTINCEWIVVIFAHIPGKSVGNRRESPKHKCEGNEVIPVLLLILQII